MEVTEGCFEEVVVGRQAVHVGRVVVFGDLVGLLAHELLLAALALFVALGLIVLVLKHALLDASVRGMEDIIFRMFLGWPI